MNRPGNSEPNACYDFDESLLEGMTPSEAAGHRDKLSHIIDACAPIAEYLNDKDVTDIYRNPDGKLWVKRFGEDKINPKILPTPFAARICNLTASFWGKTFNHLPKNAILTDSLPYYGCRIEAIHPPYVDSTTFAIRKKPSVIYSLDQYVHDNRLSVEHRMFISEMVREKQNILVVGATGSGKTTLLNAIIQDVGRQEPNHRLIVVEDTRELQCDVSDFVGLNMDANSSHLGVKTALRLFPQRIIFGEVRHPESAASIIEAWGTGHGGGTTSIHAESALEALYRLRTFLLQANAYNAGSKINQTIRALVFIENVNKRGPVVTACFRVQPRMNPSKNGEFLIDKVGRSILEVERGDLPIQSGFSINLSDYMTWGNENVLWTDSQGTLSLVDMLASQHRKGLNLNALVQELKDKGLLTA